MYSNNKNEYNKVLNFQDRPFSLSSTVFLFYCFLFSRLFLLVFFIKKKKFLGDYGIVFF